jgi:hypothetical protein
MSTVDAVVVWLQASAVSQAIVASPWLWPAAETLHFIGLALVVGIVGFLDLRLTGLFPSVSIAALRELMPLAFLGFGVNTVTGLIFLVGHPEQYAHNVAWWMKVGCLLLAGVNAAVFEWTLAGRVLHGATDEARTGDACREGALPLAARCVGVVSLVAWFGVLYWGRMLPFIGDAF